MKKYIFSVLLVLIALSSSHADQKLLPSVKLISLSADELKEIGIATTANSAEYRELRAGEEIRVLIKNEKIQLKNLTAKILPDNPSFAPRLAVVADGHGSVAYFRDLKDFQKADSSGETASAITNSYAKANELVAVHFSLATKQSRKNDETFEVYLWYEPTSEFIEKLPDRYKEEINQEKTAPTPDESYFPKQTSSAIVSTSIYPNPATDGNAVLKINFARATSAEVGISDISGNAVAGEIRSQDFAMGETEVRLSLSDLSPGMYIVSVRTADGETVSQRLIVLH
jgi:hypothetical protein